MSKAVILFSGGLDSTTCLAIAKSQGHDCYALSFNYGQKHHAELEAAKKIARLMNVVEHRIFNLAMDELGGSALTDANYDVPDYQNSKEIPITYVPARNTIFLSIALGWAEVINAYHIFTGANAVDYSNYPDCRPEYIECFEKLSQLATKSGVEANTFKIHAPLIKLTKAEIIRTGMELGLDYSLTVTCYRANEKGEACGSCDACAFRRKGFKEANIIDPTRYI